MRSLDVRLELSDDDLREAGEDVARLLERDLELTPSLRAVLDALDDAITREFAGG